MTDIIKDFEQKVSGEVASFLRKNKEFEEHNVALFQQEILDLKSDNPLILAFGNQSFKILNKHFRNRYQIIKLPHYSMYISRENYKNEIGKVLGNIGTVIMDNIQENNVKDKEGIKYELKRLQRVYEITPSDEAMNLLIKEGMNSAFHITQISEKKFVERFSKVFGKCLAHEVYAEALRIHSLKGNI